MERESFDRSLRAFVHRVPFAPFVVELVNGNSLRVDHPEALVTRGGGVAMFVSPDSVYTLFDHQGVASLHGLPDSTPTKT